MSRPAFTGSRPGAYALIAGIFLFLAGLALFLYGTKVETRRFRLERLKARIGKGRPSGRTLKILHISDLHLQQNDHKKVEFIRAITDDDYDMVVLTGDIFQFNRSFDFGPFLLARKPRLGAYAVLGNHDYYDYSLINKTVGRIFKNIRQPDIKKDVAPHRRALEAGGFTVLVNQACTIEDGNIFVAGLDYPGINDADLAALMAEAGDENQLKLCLFHLPWRLQRLADSGFDMVFGGHTHGGQIRLPGFGALITDSELHRSEASGLLQRGRTHFHISRGLGADPRSNLRLFCPPAATVIELSY